MAEKGIRETMEHVKGCLKSWGRKYWGESEMDGGIQWALLVGIDPDVSDDDVLGCLEGFYPYAGGVGRYFQDKPQLHRLNSRILVKQRFGWDV